MSLGGDSLRPCEYPDPLDLVSPDDSFLTDLSYDGCKGWFSHFSIPSTFTSQSSVFNCKNLPFPAFIHLFIYLSLIIRMHSWILSFFHCFIITGATYFCAQVLLCCDTIFVISWVMTVFPIWMEAPECRGHHVPRAYYTAELNESTQGKIC